MANKVIRWVLVGLAIIGLADATILTVQHYAGTGLSCTITHGCETVLTSKYSAVFGIPVALLGMLFYFSVLIIASYLISSPSRLLKQIALFMGTVGFVSSLGLVYIQGFVLHAWCQYCLLSALTSTLIFITSLLLYSNNDSLKEVKK